MRPSCPARAWSTIATLLVLFAIAAPAHAQFSFLRESQPQQPGAAGKVYRPVSVGIAPLTFFDINTVGKRPDGSSFIKKSKSTAPLLVVEKTYVLESPESVSIGAWYWRSSNTTDRFGLYGKYFPNSRIGGQLTAGGDTHVGFFEYYAFLLFNALRGTVKTPLSIQLGAGPYIPRTSIGDVGYTAVVEASYALKHYWTLTASYWYVDYKSSLVGFTQHNNLSRASLGIGYSF